MTSFGALPVRGGARFRVSAPLAKELTLEIHTGRAAGARPMPRDGHGVHDLIVDGASAGDRYSYRIDGGDLRPDPASRFQPEGVHGPSEIVDPAAFGWSDERWRGRLPRDLVVYELHVGTFSPEGTFDGARRRLTALRDLGVTAIEVMPVAEFAGCRNWGYDGVSLYAPSRAYGRPDDLRRFVDAAHALALSVVLDVVYNHLGPEGAYIGEFNPQFLTGRHETPWGRAVNLDGPGSDHVRRFIIENALHWVREYHVDGLRLDATHALIDDSPVHLVAELAEAVTAVSPHALVLHAEDHRNLNTIVQPRDRGGWGLNGLWADDFHHIVRCMLAGDSHSYFSDFSGTAEELCTVLRRGWLYTGQYSKNMKEHRGTDPSAVPMRCSVVCLQNHDQVGNRAMGERLHHAIPPEQWRAATALLLTTPMTPLLFMGQEWAASSPFRYFTDLEPGLGELVTAGRRKEFSGFPEFSDPVARERIPDPQAPATFEASRLRWEERDEPAHASVLALYQRLLSLRLEHPALGASDDPAADAFVVDAGTVALRRTAGIDSDAGIVWVIVKLRGEGTVTLASVAPGPLPSSEAQWEMLLTTEEAPLAPDPVPLHVDWSPDGPIVHFRRPGAILLKQAAAD